VQFACTKQSILTKWKKINIYKTLIGPLATYGAEGWALKVDICKWLELLI